MTNKIKIFKVESKEHYSLINTIAGKLAASRRLVHCQMAPLLLNAVSDHCRFYIEK